MKKILFIAFLFLGLGTFAQTKLVATAVRNSPSDTYPVTYDSLQRGGMHVYSSTIERDALPLGLRKIGMLAAVDTVIYQLKGGITNSNWSLFKPGGGGSQNLQQVTSIDSVSTRKVTVGKFRITDLREFENNTQAIDAGLEVGDEYRLPYNDGAYRIAIVILQNITMGFTVTAGENVDIAIADNNTQDRTIDWGDGVIDFNPGGTYSHVYTNAGTYNVKFIVNNISGINAIIVNTGNLISYLQPYLPSLTSLKFSGLSLSTVQVNAILIQMNIYGYAGLLQTDGQTPPAPPSGAGITAKNAIIARGGTVTTD